MLIHMDILHDEQRTIQLGKMPAFSLQNFCRPMQDKYGTLR